MAKKKKKFKIAIIPQSGEENHYDCAETIRDAKECSKEYEKETGESSSLKVFSYETEAEREAFIEGYEAMVGWMGDGRFITENVK